MKLYEFYAKDGEVVGIMFGRFQPSHLGHATAWKMMMDECDYWYVGTNKSTIGKKDPLPSSDKTASMEKVFPPIKGNWMYEQSWLTMAARIYKKHPDAKLVLYTDEVWVIKAIQKYNGEQNKHGFYDFHTIEHKATPRVSSATAVRQAVGDNDFAAFQDAVGPAADEAYFELVKDKLSVYSESVNESVNEAGIGDLFRKFNHKDRNKYPKAAQMYRKMAKDIANDNKEKLHLATEVAMMFGFDSIRDFATYLAKGKNVNVEPELLPKLKESTNDNLDQKTNKPRKS